MRYIILSLLLLSPYFCKAQAYKLWYTTPAVKWTDALPIGNGRLGAMVFGGVEKDRLQFNEETLWTGEPRAYNRQGAATYLTDIRKLLAEGRQKEAEQLAEAHFMGLKSSEGNRAQWLEEVFALKGLSVNPALPELDDSGWKTMPVPAYDGWETVGFEGLDGAVWLRTTINIPANWQGKNLILDLNRIRDHDRTYVNGKLIGTSNGTEARRYVIPKEYVMPGNNVIAVQVINYADKGGIMGYKETSRPIAVYPEGANFATGISLNGNWRYLIQHDNPPSIGKYQAEYQPFGDLTLAFKGIGSVTDYRRELTLNEAISRTSFTANGAKYTREYLASQPHQVVAVHLTADKPGRISLDAVLSSPHKSAVSHRIDARTLALSVKVRHGALIGESYLWVDARKGSVIVTDNAISIDGADEVTLYLTAATNFINPHDVSGKPTTVCQKTIAALARATYGQVKQAHMQEYRRYYNTFSIDLGKAANDALPTDEQLAKFGTTNDPAFMALYVQYGRYLLISSSRPGTRPANLQGIWNDLLTPPWGSKYTTNINLEMNYWPAEVLNLSPLNQPLFGMIQELVANGRETAKLYYNAKGWVLHHNTDLWRGTAPINASNHGIWVSGAGWLSQHLWEHFLYTQDKAFLKNTAYPIMKEAAEFFVDFLVKDKKTGWLISSPSNSPENGGLVAGPTMDHQIIRTLFRNCIKASEVLKTDENFRNTLQHTYQQIAPNQIGRFGQLQEWLEDKDDTTNKHRHVSHLWGVHPGDDITWESSPELMKAARQSLLYRGDEGTGWSLAWKINFWARFNDGEHTMKMIRMLLRPASGKGGSYLNLFDAHPPFQIDGNFGGSAGIAEMLLQSHTRFLDILPALPASVSDGRVSGIRARGGFELSFSWKNGKLATLSVKSIAGNTCTLRYAGKMITLPTQPGKTYVLDGRLN